MLNLATDPRAEKCRQHTAEMVESMRELLSPDCPEDLLKTKYAAGRYQEPTSHLSEEDKSGLLYNQRFNIKILQDTAFDIRDNGFSEEESSIITTQWRAKDSTIWVKNGTHRMAIGLALGLEIIPAFEPDPLWLRCPLCDCSMEIHEVKPGKLQPKEYSRPLPGG